MVELSGRCLCGAVRWRYGGPLTRNLVCHCESCQRAASAPFAAFIGVRPDGLTWSGAITHYESSPATFRGFCTRCGSRLYFRSDRWPGEIHLHAATLDDARAYQPTAQVMLSEQAPWLARLGEVQAHSGFDAEPGAEPPSDGVPE